jgi:hypothetical protein
MDGYLGSNQLAFVRRSARIAVIAAVAIALLFVGLLLVERSGPSPVHATITLVGQNKTTTTTGATTTTIGTTTTTSQMGQNCNDNDQHTGEGTPSDLTADASNGNGNGGDGCPSGV